MGFTTGYKPDSNPGSVNLNRDAYMDLGSTRSILSGSGLSLPGLGDEQGTSFADIVKKVITTAPAVYSSQLGTTIRNALPSSDDLARPGFAGEQHAILRLPNGKFGVGNYIGPKTALLKRLKRGDPPRTEVDKVAMAHDIRYGLADTPAQIRQADEIMIKKVADIRRRGADSRMNIGLANLMKAKVLGENLGLLKRDAFSGDLSQNRKLPQADRELMERELAKIAPSGYGLTLPGGAITRPGDELKLRLLKKQAKQRKSGAPPNLKKKTRGESSKKGFTGKDFRLVGSGMDSGEDFHALISQYMIPSLLESVGVDPRRVPVETIVKLTTKAFKMAESGNLEDIARSLSKHILPFLTATRLGGRGLKLAGQGMRGGMFDKLGDKLNDAIFRALKWVIKHAIKTDTRPGAFAGSGINLPGGSFGSFWKDFKKGFMSVINPAIAVAKTVAPLVPLLL